MRWLAALALGAALCAGVLPGEAQESPAPVNPHASPEARALLRYLYSISGRHILTGQHNYPNTIATWTDRAYDFTGKYPAVFGQDFGFQGGADQDSVLARPALVEEAKRQWRNGAIVTFTWHAVRPTDDEPVGFRESVQGHLSEFEWRELLTPGTDLYRRWCAQVDVVAGYLKQLRDAHVPVLWRPYHEVNGGWFWWGGRKGPDGSAALYRQLFDRFVKYHKLDNLVWVWNVNAPGAGGKGPGPYPDYFPGLAYADVLSVDIYGEFKQSHYDDLVALAAGKPVALGEVGTVPTPEVLAAQPRFTWFMTWSSLVEMSNSIEGLRATYNAPSALSRDDAALAGAMAAIRTASPVDTPEPVTSQVTSEARELLATLYGACGKNVLSGQENGAASPAGLTERVFEITSKYPAIYSQDMGIPKDAGGAIVEEAKRQHRNHAIVSLSWHPARPTGDPATASPDSARAGLSDFEWKELLTPGTHLYERWSQQVDAVAVHLEQLQKAGIAVLWRPYPQPNGKSFWWAGRKGAEGSAALYRQLFDRLVNHHGLRNLVWVWHAAAPGFGPGAAGRYADYFPGLPYADALAVDLGASRFPRDAELARFAVGKVIGVALAGWTTPPGLFGPQSKWAWFLASPDGTDGPGQADALRQLYSNPRVISRTPEGASR